MLPDLDTLLDYRHDAVIRNFLSTQRAQGNPRIDEAKAQALFTHMLKYLWISKKHELDKEKNPGDLSLQFPFVMHEEMRDIDNLWHCFILYTQDYTAFCHRFFGEYLHHLPDVAEGHRQTPDQFSKDMENYLSYVYDNLGEETVREWFATHLN